MSAQIADAFLTDFSRQHVWEEVRKVVRRFKVYDKFCFFIKVVCIWSVYVTDIEATDSEW
jgi:hypothetical protein